MKASARAAKLASRQREYDRMTSGGTSRGRSVGSVSSLAFHKPGSNKK